MTFYTKDGGCYRQSAALPVEIVEGLPLGTYALKADLQGFKYEPIDDYTMPGKVYGDLTTNRDRIINTFVDRPSTTGVMLAGEKGSGKTLLAKAISIEARERLGYSTIVINTPFAGEAFNTLIQEMEDPAVILFDEYEKVYGEEEQKLLLTLFDGLYPTKKLFVITTNDSWRIDSHMRNRPGRIYYMLNFKGLSDDFIREYSIDNLKNQKDLEGLMLFASIFSEFNFDMLKGLIEEMNRYDLSASDAARMLNVKPGFSNSAHYDVSAIYDGKPIELYYNHGFNGNPITEQVNVTVQVPYTVKHKGENVARHRNVGITVDPSHIVEGKAGMFVYETTVSRDEQLSHEDTERDNTDNIDDVHVKITLTKKTVGVYNGPGGF